MPTPPAPPGWLQENFVTFLPNYLRLAAGVLLATFYLRPKALLGAAAVVGSLYRSATLAYRRQQQQQQAAAAAGAAAGTDGRAARQQQQQQPQANAAAGMPVNRRWAAGTDPNEQLVTAATTLLTWLLVAYTRCLPMLMLGAFARAGTGLRPAYLALAVLTTVLVVWRHRSNLKRLQAGEEPRLGVKTHPE